MSGLSGFDSEAVGFDSVSQNVRPEASSSTQTCYFSETGVGCQTEPSKDCGSLATPEDLAAEEGTLKEYPPPGLNEFLRRVVPGMIEQLDQNDNDNQYEYNSSDSDEEDIVTARLFQEIKIKPPVLGAGDHQPSSVLGVTWSSAGNSVAVSIGKAQHETWCEHDGLIKIYTARRAEGDRFVHTMDLSEKNCISVLKYHPAVAALLAYGTTSGEVVVLCNLQNTTSSLEKGMQFTSPAGCHGSKRVSGLQWADSPLTNTFLKHHIANTGKRRGASDQVLISAGSDGTINVWQVNSTLGIFQNIICYSINGSKKMAAPDISCFDFIKTFPLRPSDEKVAEDIFVVGTKSGKLYLCKTKTHKLAYDSGMVDPVYDVLDGHQTCVLNVAFSFARPGVFASISMDSELRVYDVNQSAPIKILCLDVAISCMSWLPNNPCLVVLGLAEDEKELLRVYNVSSGRQVPIAGFDGRGSVTALAVNQAGSCRIAAGDSESCLRVFDLPARQIRLTAEDLDF